MSKANTTVGNRQPEFGSDLICDLMKLLDIEYAALSPGSTFRGIQDSIVNYSENSHPKVIFCCHEEISVALAQGYAKARGKPMVSIVHNIVGLQHASMAIFNAWCDRVPVIVLGGTGPMDTEKRRPRIDWIHTALVQGSQVRDYVKWDDQPASLAAVPESLIRGCRIATTEPMAPVYICYDVDIQEEVVSSGVEIPDVSRYAPPPPVQANPQALRRTAQLLVEAQSPLIIADYVGRHPETVSSLVELAELLTIPVVDKCNRFNFPNTHPLDITEGEQEFLEKADVILALDVQDLYGSLTTSSKTTRKTAYQANSEAKIVHISLNDMLVHSWAGDYQRLPAVDVPISADTSVALPELIRLCRQELESNRKSKVDREARFNEVKKVHESLRRKWIEQTQASTRGEEISTAFLAHELWEVIKSEDWVLVNGTARGWARRLWDWTRPYQYLGASGGEGVGYGISASLGAALAHLGTDRVCVDIQADGDLLMSPSALWTAAHHQIPLLIVVHNNRSFYNSEEHALKIAKFRGRPVENAGIGTHLDDPPVNFAEMARSFGVHGEGPINRHEELRPALERALQLVKEKRVPALVDVISEPR